jgi:predicted nucleotidyltransferase
VDDTLRATVAAFEATFPGRVRGYYVQGSRADGSGLSTSDLDLCIVFRDLFRSTGWAATALIAWQASQYVARKRDCHVTYRALIGDEWSDLLEDVYVLCRGQWRYLIPDAPADRARLCAICARTLGFERHFLAAYRRFLLAELRGGGDGARMALDVLERLPWRDDEIAAARTAAQVGA